MHNNELINQVSQATLAYLQEQKRKQPHHQHYKQVEQLEKDNIHTENAELKREHKSLHDLAIERKTAKQLRANMKRGNGINHIVRQEKAALEQPGILSTGKEKILAQIIRQVRSEANMSKSLEDDEKKDATATKDEADNDLFLAKAAAKEGLKQGEKAAMIDEKSSVLQAQEEESKALADKVGWLQVILSIFYVHMVFNHNDAFK